ncbi:MAG: type II secretion system protein [Deltaproteobacteria bacterium]|nr:type II secretion system protein [Deltaproteobacteria bacterium]
MRQRGFTLIEMMVALLLGSIAAISLTLITRSMTQTAQNEQMIVEASQAARAGIDMLRFDFMRTGMFYAANPRHDDNKNSMVSRQGGGAGMHQAYFRNPIVHLNSGGTGPDTVILVGNFIGDNMYEGMVDADNDEVTIFSAFREGMCRREFDGNYAFAHLVTAKGQTHEAKVNAADPPVEEECSDGVCQKCTIHIMSGELIDKAFGERNVKIGANQAVMYRVESPTPNTPNRQVLMRYFINYDSSTASTLPTSGLSNTSRLGAVVIAENVVDFQVWFRAVDPSESGPDINRGADQAYYTNAAGTTLPSDTDTIVNESRTGHLPIPAAGNINDKRVFPEHVRSAIISLAVRMERTDQLQERGGAAGSVLTNELANAPADADGKPLDVGNYKIRRFTVEVKLPNIESQMALFQNGETLNI